MDDVVLAQVGHALEPNERASDKSGVRCGARAYLGHVRGEFDQLLVGDGLLLRSQVAEERAHGNVLHNEHGHWLRHDGFDFHNVRVAQRLGNREPIKICA